MLAVPLPVGATLYQIVLTLPVTGNPEICEHAGVGSFVSVVAPELSFVSVKFVVVILLAFAKLSFTGAGATTLKVGRVTVAVVNVVPPPGGGFWTPTEFVLPKFAMKVAGTVAVSCVELTKVVGIADPPTSGFMSTLEFEPKLVPVTVMVVAAEFTGALAGAELAIVGTWPITVNGSAFVVFGVCVVSWTVTCTTAPPERSAAVICAVSCVELTNEVVRALPPQNT